QGYQRASAPPASGTALSFTQLISGDYGHLTSGDGDHDLVYCTYPGFVVYATYPGCVLAQVGENNPLLVQVGFPPASSHAWMPPVVADPLEPRRFFFCASRLYRYLKGSTNSWASALWSSFAFDVSPGEYVSALAFSPVDPQRAYAVTDRGRLCRSNDHGVTWTAST